MKRMPINVWNKLNTFEILDVEKWAQDHADQQCLLLQAEIAILKADNNRLRQSNSAMSSAVTRNDDQRKAESAARQYFDGGKR